VQEKSVRRRQSFCMECLGESYQQKVGSLGSFACDPAPEFEAALVSHAVLLLQMLFGLNTVELRKLAYEVAEKKKLTHRFKNQIAGKTWMKSFLQRHPELVIRTPEAIFGDSVRYDK